MKSTYMNFELNRYCISYHRSNNVNKINTKSRGYSLQDVWEVLKDTAAPTHSFNTLLEEGKAGIWRYAENQEIEALWLEEKWFKGECDGTYTRIGLIELQEDKATFGFVPDYVWEQIDYEIARGEYECVNNYRACRWALDSTKFADEKQAYEQARESGCYGFFDSKFTYQGEQWCIGFNYGD